MTTIFYRARFPRTLLCLVACLVMTLASTPHAGAQVSGCHPVINEVLTGTAELATEEFVELFNPCPPPITLDGWRLVYRSATNLNPVTGGDTALLFTLQGRLPQGGYRVYGGPGYRGPSSGALLSGIPEGDGAVGLRDRDSILIDSVGFGATMATNYFTEGGMPALVAPLSPSPGTSLMRIPNGMDSNNNGSDFRLSRLSLTTPMAYNHFGAETVLPGGKKRP